MPNQHAPEPIERVAARSTNGKTLGGRDLEVRDVSAMASVQPPPMPPGLKARGKAEWRKIWQAGKWLWPEQDYAWVEQVSRSYDDLATFRAVVTKDGLTVDGYAGQKVAHPLIAEMRKCEDTIRRCLSTLGFSPTDRARLKLTELKGASELKKLVNSGTNDSEAARKAYEYAEGEW
jgi:P27 family predicted phage terminase small subunit